MEIFINLHKPYLSNALRRIEEGIRLTLPKKHTIIDNPNIADIIIYPVINAKDIDFELSENAIIWQLCYLTAGETEDFWQYVWDKSMFVVSYLNLPLERPKFLRMPLGFDPKLFYPGHDPKKYDILVTGFMDGNNAELIKPLVDIFDSVAHIGENFKFSKNYHHFVNINDVRMRNLYQQATFVAGLRYIEGFELPIIEGGACGAIQIFFNMECYNHWFQEFGLAIDPANPIDGLRRIKEDTDYFVKNRSRLFDTLYYQYTWDNVMRPFWDKIL